MTETDVLAELTDVLELETEACINDEFRNYEEWDSLTFLSLITYMRDEHGVNLDIDAFNQINTWNDLYRLVAE